MRSPIAPIVLAALAITLTSASTLAGGGYTDQSPQPGLQTLSWAEPSTINVYLPAGLTGPARDAFKIGVQAWTAVLPRISVTFRDGPPPAGAPNAVAVNIVPQPDGQPLANAQPTAPSFTGEGHRSTITGGNIQIDPSALLSEVFMRNVGTHDFGHILGLADCPAGDPRSDAMDPFFEVVFDQFGGVVSASPYIPPSPADIATLAQHYTVPAPSTAALLALAALVTSRRRRA